MTLHGSVIIPSPASGWLSMSRQRQAGSRLFRKHILTRGPLTHPATGEKIEIDDDFISHLETNFSSGVCPIVQVPVANDRNEHSEDPLRNIGEVVGLETEGGKVFAVIDARDKAAADKIGSTLLGASAMLSLDYKDTRTNEKVGPTLLHVCVTNRPYVTDLDDYQEILAASADIDSDAVLLTGASEREPTVATLEELLATLKDEHGIDVSALQMKAEEAEASSTALSTALSSALSKAGVLSLSSSNEEEITDDDVIGAVAELANTNSQLTARLGTLEHKDAEREVDAKVKGGYVMPSQRDAMVELRLTNSEMYEKLLPVEPLVSFTKESGVAPPEDESHQKNIDSEIARLTGDMGPAAQYIRNGK